MVCDDKEFWKGLPLESVGQSFYLNYLKISVYGFSKIHKKTAAEFFKTRELEFKHEVCDLFRKNGNANEAI